MMPNPEGAKPPVLGGIVQYLMDWATCQTRWWNGQLRHHPNAPPGQLGIEPKQLGPALVIGGAVHKALEEWYLSGWDYGAGKDTGYRDLDRAIQGGVEHLAAQGHRLKGGEDAYVKAEAEVRGLMLGYHKRWEGDPIRVASHTAEDGSVVPLVEQEFVLDLGRGYQFTARLDAVVVEPDDPEGLWVLEHKTSDVSRLAAFKEALYVDGQITGQHLQLEAHFPGRARGVLANLLVKRAKSVPPYQREPHRRGMAQLEKFQMDARRRLGAMREAVETYTGLVEGCGMSQDEAARVAFDASHAGSTTCQGCAFVALCKNRSQSEWVVEVDYQAKEPR